MIKVLLMTVLIVSLSGQIAYAGDYWRNKLSGASTAARNFAYKVPKKAPKIAVEAFKISCFGASGIPGAIMRARGAERLSTAISTFANKYPKAPKIAVGAFNASPLGMGIKTITILRRQDIRKQERPYIPNLGGGNATHLLHESNMAEYRRMYGDAK
jgi:hypothetical protein